MKKNSDLVALWKESLLSEDHSTGTIKKYTQAVVYFLNWYEAEQGRLLKLSDLNPITLIGYRNELQIEQRKSVSTINLRISALRAWCNWLVDAGYLASDPSARLKLVNGKQISKRDGLSHSQVNALLRQAQSCLRDRDRNFAIIQVLLQTGIRLGECAAIAYGDIVFGERSGMLTIRAGKGNKVRSVPINASARDALAVYVGSLREIEHASIKTVAAIWPKPSSPESFQPIWISQKGGALSASAMGQMIAELVEGASPLVPEDTTAHILRHTFAHNYLTQYPGDIVGLATLLGHKSVDTTRIYSQPSAEQLAVRLEQLSINAYAQ